MTGQTRHDWYFFINKNRAIGLQLHRFHCVPSSCSKDVRELALYVFDNSKAAALNAAAFVVVVLVVVLVVVVPVVVVELLATTGVVAAFTLALLWLVFGCISTPAFWAAAKSSVRSA